MLILNKKIYFINYQKLKREVSEIKLGLIYYLGLNLCVLIIFII